MSWPKYWSFSFIISPSSEHPGLISFRMDWLDLLTVQGTLKSLLQHHSSKPSILRRSAFFTVQLSHGRLPASDDGRAGRSGLHLLHALPDRRAGERSTDGVPPRLAPPDRCHTRWLADRPLARRV